MSIYAELKEKFKKENSIIRTVKNKDNPYVMINKLGIQDPNLTWAAKGLLAYLLSQPDDWSIYVKELIKHTSSGRDHTYTVIKELLKYGYMEKVEYRYNGKVLALNYTVFEVPIDVSNHDNTKARIVKIDHEGNVVESIENSTCEPHPENTETAKTDSVSTELLINDFNNKDFTKEKLDVDDATEKIISLYKSLKIEKKVMPHSLKLIRENASRFSEDVWVYIFSLAGEDHVISPFKYMRDLVADYIKANVYSMEDVANHEAKYKESKKKAKSGSKEKRPLTRFHNINQRFDKYTPEELEKILKENQKAKFAKEDAERKQRTSFHNFNETFTQYSEEELNDAITKSQEAKYGKPQATPENPADFVVTEEIYQDALKDWSKYRIVQKIMIRDYARANNRFMPGFWNEI